MPEYKNELGEVIGKYEIIKNEGLVDMPLKIYEYCEEIIKSKKTLKQIKTLYQINQLLTIKKE